MLPLPFDPHRLKVRVLRLRMVGNQLLHSQLTMNSVLDGILALTVVQILSCRYKHVCLHCSQQHKGKSCSGAAGSSTKNNDHFTRSNGDCANQT